MVSLFILKQSCRPQSGVSHNGFLGYWVSPREKSETEQRLPCD